MTKSTARQIPETFTKRVVHIKRNDEIGITFCDRIATDLDVFDDEEGATCGACFTAYQTHYCDFYTEVMAGTMPSSYPYRV